jgi:hypothetical protein
MYKQSPGFLVVDQIDAMKYRAINPVQVAGTQTPRLQGVVVSRTCHTNFFILTT